MQDNTTPGNEIGINNTLLGRNMRQPSRVMNASGGTTGAEAMIGESRHRLDEHPPLNAVDHCDDPAPIEAERRRVAQGRGRDGEGVDRANRQLDGVEIIGRPPLLHAPKCHH